MNVDVLPGICTVCQCCFSKELSHSINLRSSLSLHTQKCNDCTEKDIATVVGTLSGGSSPNNFGARLSVAATFQLSC